MFKVRHYTSATGRSAFAEWLRKMQDIKAKAAIIRRVNRIELGNFSDRKACREGVWELRIDVGPGYRVYYAQINRAVILLLCGGDKGSQGSDIVKACEYWQEWRRNKLKQEDS